MVVLVESMFIDTMSSVSHRETVNGEIEEFLLEIIRLLDVEIFTSQLRGIFQRVRSIC